MPPAALIAGRIPSSSSSTPFFIVPAHPPTSSANNKPRNVTFAQPVASKPSRRQEQQQSEIPVVIDTATLVSYKAPEHKHAHHLHSIPPRDKTAKTLILDHMLWQHSRARFLQAHSELGLPSNHAARPGPSDTDSLGPRDAVRSPPELLLEDDIRALKYGVRGIDRIKASFEHNADDRYTPSVDLDTARIQRATADGMEKVVASLLNQTITACSTSDDGRHNHGNSNTPCLYHGVRMRIALSALVNDFFARDHHVTHMRDVDEDEELESDSEMGEVEEEAGAPALVRRSSSASESRMSISSLVTTHATESPSPVATPSSSFASLRAPLTLSGVQADETSSGMSNAAATSSPSVRSGVGLNTVKNSQQTIQPHAASIDPPLPRILHTLLRISSYNQSPSARVDAASQQKGKAIRAPRPSLAPPNSIFSAVPRGAGPDSPWALGPGQGMGWPARVPLVNGEGDSSHGQTPRVWKAIGRSRELFNGGVTGGVNGPGSSKVQASAKSKWVDDASASKRVINVNVASAVGSAACPRHLRSTDDCPQTCIHSTNAAYALGYGQQRHPRATTIGAGLSQAGYPLRRPVHDPSSSSASTASSYTSKSSPTPKPQYGETRMADVLPRFLRFSALIAKELGREARETGEQSIVDAPTDTIRTTSSGSPQSSPSPSPRNTFIADPPIDTDPRTAPSTTGDARPSRVWYALLCGIVTRAVLEGYIRGEWKGPDPLEVLFGLGMPPQQHRTSSSKGSVSTTSSSMQDDGEYSDAESSYSATSSSGSSEDEQEDFEVDEARFEPDGMPSIEDAIRILFGRGLIPQQRVQPTYFASPTTSPISTSGGFFPKSPVRDRAKFSVPGGKTPWSPGNMARPGVGGGDPDWEWETSERISEFATISLNSPDLLTHLHELSRRYPPEPVERAALRFFESVADWRGTPELENYKARRAPPAAAAASAPAAHTEPTVKMEEDDVAPSLGGDSGSAIPATTPAPQSPIFGYFIVPREMCKPTQRMSTPPSAPPSKKRGADDHGAQDRIAKSARSNATFAQDTIEPGWTGPYGV